MKSPAPGCIAMIPEDDEKLGQKVEDWAILYSHMFSHLYSNRYPTAYAFSVGSIYASKKLPEHELVTLLLKCAALAYVLRAGVKCPTSEFHTIQARIDTLLYHRLQNRDPHSMQRYRGLSGYQLEGSRGSSYGQLHIFSGSKCDPSASDRLTLTTLSRGRKSLGTKTTACLINVDKLSNCFNLLLSTHTALFRSHSPIIMDFTDPANQDILGGDQEMINEAMKLRNIILNFREHSLSRPFKSSNGYKDSTYGRFRKVLNGRGEV